MRIIHQKSGTEYLGLVMHEIPQAQDSVSSFTTSTNTRLYTTSVCGF